MTTHQTPPLWHAMALAAGLAMAQAAGAAQIVIAQVAPLSGMDANQGRAYAAGMQLALDNANKAGGVNGNTFSLVSKDDGGHPQETLAMTRQLLADSRPMLLAGYCCSRNVTDLIASGMLEKEHIALVGYRTAELRTDVPLVYNVRASLGDEILKIVEHLATIGITQLGLLYEDGPGAASLQTAASEAVKRVNARIIASASYPSGTVSVSKAVAQFMATPPQAILLVTTGAAAASFIEQYRSRGGAAQLFAHSGADIEQLSKRLGEEQMQGVAIAQVTPNPYKVSSRLSKEFNDTVAKASGSIDVPVSYTMMEGYITGKVIVEAVRRMGAKPSREGVPAALEGMDSYDLGGYRVGFQPGHRSGSRFVELSIISSTGRIRQ